MGDMTLESQIAALIVRQQLNAEQLLALLEQERQALLEATPERLMELIAAKEEQARVMTETQNQLLTLARSHDYSGPQRGLNQFIQDSDASGRLVPEWEALLQSAEQCRKLNESNGATVNLKKRFTESGLAILHGQIDPQPGATTYSKKGITSGQSGSRVLHKA